MEPSTRQCARCAGLAPGGEGRSRAAEEIAAHWVVIAGLTRQSILFEKICEETMDPRVKAGGDAHGYVTAPSIQKPYRHPRSMTPPSPSSAPPASAVPVAFQASAVIGAPAPLRAKTSAPSSIRTSRTRPSA